MSRQASTVAALRLVALATARAALCASPECQIVIEIDGDSHFSAEGQENDQQRDAYQHSLGLSVLRFTNVQVMQDLEGMYAVINSAI